MRRLWITLLALTMIAGFSGCLKHEIKAEIAPIQITLDINLKVQKDIEDFWDLD